MKLGVPLSREISNTDNIMCDSYCDHHYTMPGRDYLAKVDRSPLPKIPQRGSVTGSLGSGGTAVPLTVPKRDVRISF